MAMPTREPVVATIEELLALPHDGLRHELLDGVHVVTPAPELLHQAVLGEFAYALRRALEGNDELVLFTSPADVTLGPRTLVQPDLFVVRKEPGRRLKRWSEVGVPALAVEFLSPGTAARDRGAKRRIYQRAGVPEYWIADLDARLVERWRPGDERPEVVSEALVWEAPGLPSPVRLDLPPIFVKVLGESSP
jgi:Uma2 family endonuclease